MKIFILGRHVQAFVTFDVVKKAFERKLPQFQDLIEG